MRAPLAAIADDNDVLGLDEVEIGIAIVIDAHRMFLPYACLLLVLFIVRKRSAAPLPLPVACHKASGRRRPPSPHRKGRGYGRGVSVRVDLGGRRHIKKK